MQPLDLIASAEILVASSRGKPSQVSLRRATSSVYYALFHCLARNGADLLVGGPGANRSESAWRQTYRALEHGFAKAACKDRLVDDFAQGIQDFSGIFVTMQEKRHAADYDPSIRLTKSEVVADIGTARKAIIGFRAVSTKDRRAFSAHVLFKKRPA